MWCIECRQDVPALLSGDKESFCCPRCGGDLCAENNGDNQSLSSEDERVNNDCMGSEGVYNDGAAVQLPPQHSADGWEIGEQLREIGRALQGTRCDDRESKTDNRRESMRFDQPHAELPDWHAPVSERSYKRRKTETDNRAAASPLTWLSLALGTTGFVCGGVLMGWSLAADRPELWTLGLPTALVGQISLLIGLVIQLDRLRRDNRHAATKLDHVDKQLNDLKTSATLLSGSQGPTSTAFYSHFAGGAGPQLLLTDLKSQLDLLATRIAREE